MPSRQALMIVAVCLIAAGIGVTLLLLIRVGAGPTSLGIWVLSIAAVPLAVRCALRLLTPRSNSGTMGDADELTVKRRTRRRTSLLRGHWPGNERR